MQPKQSGKQRPNAIRLAEQNGFVPFERRKRYQARCKVYYNNRWKGGDPGMYMEQNRS